MEKELEIGRLEKNENAWVFQQLPVDDSVINYRNKEKGHISKWKFKSLTVK